jgi:hypothetical protein
MKNKWSRKSLKNIQAAVWLIGLGVLYMLDAFWPGILILIGISLFIKSLMPEPEESQPEPNKQAITLDEAEDEEVEEIHEGMSDPVPPPLDEPLQVFASNLPKECPNCGGPVAENAMAVKPAGEDAVLCPFCDTRIILE